MPAIGVGAAAIMGGADFLGSLASRIFGSGDRRRIRRFAEFLQSQLGTDVFSPQDQERIFGLINRSLAPQRNLRAEAVNKRLGLGSGVAQGELATSFQSDEARIRADLASLGERFRFQRDQNFVGNISGLLSGLN